MVFKLEASSSPAPGIESPITFSLFLSIIEMWYWAVGLRLLSPRKCQNWKYNVSSPATDIQFRFQQNRSFSIELFVFFSNLFCSRFISFSFYMVVPRTSLFPYTAIEYSSLRGELYRIRFLLFPPPIFIRPFMIYRLIRRLLSTCLSYCWEIITKSI